MKYLLYGIPVLSFFLYAVGMSGQKVYYVNAAAFGANDGSAWADAYTSLHDALEAAVSGDAVWVAQGIYRTDAGYDRNAYYRLKPGVRLYGGFAGDETDPSQRVAGQTPTVISGNIGNLTDSTDNAHTLLFLQAPDTNTVIDGLVFEHAYARSDSIFDNFSVFRSGGAVYVDPAGGDATPMFRHCVFRHNYAQGFGAAYFCSQSSAQGYNQPLFHYCEFTDNRSVRDGGAIYLNRGQAWEIGVDFYHCTFTGNESAARGGVVVFKWDDSASDIEFIGCTARKNVAGTQGGVGYHYVLENPRHALVIDSCTFDGNVSNHLPVHAFYATTTSWFKKELSFYNLTIKSSLFKNHGLADKPGVLITVELSGCNNTSIITNNAFENNYTTSIVIEVNQSDEENLATEVLFTANSFKVNGMSQSLNSSRLGLGGRVKTFIATDNHFHSNSGYNIRLSPGISSNFDPVITIANNLFLHEKNARSSLIEFRNFLTDLPDAENTVIANNLFLNCVSSDSFSTNAHVRRVRAYNNLFINTRDFFTGQPNLPFTTKGMMVEFDHNYMTFDCSALPGTVWCGPNNYISGTLPFLDTTIYGYQLAPCSPAINGGYTPVIAQLGLIEDLAGALRVQDEAVDIGPLESPSLELLEPPVVTASCHGAPGSATLYFTPPFVCAPLTYAWTNGAAMGNGIDDLAAGAYELTVTDSRGKTLVTDFVVPSSAPSLELAADTLLCSGETTAISASASGATGGLMYHWSTGAQTSVLAGEGPGVYSLTITDGLGCTAADTVWVSYAIPFEAEVITAPASGPDVADGSILLHIESGQPPFFLAWSTGDSTAQVDSLYPGEYQVTVTDGAGCVHLYIIQLDYTTTVQGYETAAGVVVWPNPARDAVQIEPGSYTRWRLFDTRGRLLDTRRLDGREQLDLRRYPAGQYGYVLDGEGHHARHIGRLVIVR